MIYLFQGPSVSMEQVFDNLVALLLPYSEGLNMRLTAGKSFELCGKKKVEYLGKTIDGIFVASLVRQKNYISFYFFPIYTHPEQFLAIPAVLKKARNGKSCFHIKKSNDELNDAIKVMLEKGIRLYKSLEFI